MMAIPREDEGLAIGALQRLQILDTPPEERFDRITRLTAVSFGAPIALLSLVDRQRQWFKSSYGLAIRETPRTMSFCARAVLGNEIFTVSDALEDPDFADNPLVTGPPYIRFYAGFPVNSSDGYPVGTLCVIDTKPRELDDEQRQLLRDFGGWAQNEINAVDLSQSARVARDAGMHLHSILNCMGDALVITDSKGRIELSNRATATLFGYAENELTGRNLRDVIPEPCNNERNGADWEQAQADDECDSEPALRADGSGLTIERKVTRLETSDGDRYIHLIRDAAEHDRVNRARSAFLAAAAHELRSPMASIYGFSELLLQRRIDGPRQQELLTIIHDQSAQMTHLINELLDLSRIEAMAGRDFNLGSVDPAELVRTAVAAFLVPGDRTPVELDIAAQLPHVLVDPEKTQQALNNVLSNAYKYSRAGAVRVSVSHETDRRWLSVVVRDEGIGMTPVVRDRVFERFFRADEAIGVRGTGLGMSLVKEIMEAQRGAVRIESEYGQWTEVTLLLPIALD